MKTIPTTETYKVENYPYGYSMKTEKFYSLDFKNGKGFRSSQCTVNPKTGKMNAPKKSTYYPLMLYYINEEGKIKAHVEDFYNDEGKNKGWNFIFEHFEKFTTEQIRFFAMYNMRLLKSDIYAKNVYCGSELHELSPLYIDAIQTLAVISKTGANLWDKVKVDWEKVKALKVEGFNPFKVKTYTIQYK